MRHQFSPDLESPHAPTVAQCLRPPRAGRFADTRASSSLRHLYRWLCRFMPSLAAHLAFRQLATPPRSAAGRWPVAIRELTRERRLSNGSSELAVYEWGHQGPAVLLVHGWGSNATHLARLVQPLRNAGFRVIAFDAPAHGRSTGRTTDMVAYAHAVALVARHAGPLHAVIGHSFGAAMAMYAARDWGLAASRLVLMSSFNDCNRFLEMFARHVGLTPDVLRRTRELLSQRYGGRLDWGRMSVTEMLRQANRPALVVHDENDEEIPFEHGLVMTSALQTAQLKATRGLGHHRVLRNPEVIRRITAFLVD
ncbi:alpha/beta fold hydrolase [Hydrogenophaga sp.]|uniref:alpha/beta fold hydrolase n=1 Tax=Hydrogenophaga sp. TaxID=1904254 RepID=UPI003F6ECEC9